MFTVLIVLIGLGSVLSIIGLICLVFGDDDWMRHLAMGVVFLGVVIALISATALLRKENFRYKLPKVPEVVQTK